MFIRPLGNLKPAIETVATLAKGCSLVEREEDIGVGVAANLAEEALGQAQHAAADVLVELGDDPGEERRQVAGLDVNLELKTVQMNSWLTRRCQLMTISSDPRQYRLPRGTYWWQDRSGPQKALGLKSHIFLSESEGRGF